MHADTLLLALRDLAIVIQPDGNDIRWHGPKDAMTAPLAAALREQKPLLLAVFVTLDNRARDADWDTAADWALDQNQKTFTPRMLAAARRVLPVAAEEWPEAYARRFRSALRVRALLRVFEVAPAVAPMHDLKADNGTQEVA